MKAIILAGGLGKRLRPFTFSLPKPLFPIGEKPILEHIIQHLRRYGITDITLCTGYQAELIEAFCGDGSRFGVRIKHLKEDKPLGTAGPLSLLKDRLSQENAFILMNGDIITTLNFSELLKYHSVNSFDLTVAYIEYKYISPFGVLKIPNGRVMNIIEKPIKKYKVSAGIYVISPDTLNSIPYNTFFTIPQLVRKLIASGKKVGGFLIEDFWKSLEQPDHFEEVIKEINKGILDYEKRKPRRTASP